MNGFSMPKGIRKILGIREGDVLEASFHKTGVLFKPNVLIDKESILSKKGERKIKEALDAYKKGEARSFKNARDLIRELNSGTLSEPILLNEIS
jgi:bifunctional DNA-binding transcriptional regulator/antitoxin component of YhaV-PrlF toxin-antitoxin module